MSRPQKPKPYQGKRRTFVVINTPKDCENCQYKNMTVDGVKTMGHCYMFEHFHKGCELNEV